MHFGRINQGAKIGIKGLFWVFLLHSLSPYSTLMWLHESLHLSFWWILLNGLNIATSKLLEPEAILGLNGKPLSKVTKRNLYVSSPVITTNRLNRYIIIIIIPVLFLVHLGWDSTINWTTNMLTSRSIFFFSTLTVSQQLFYPTLDSGFHFLSLPISQQSWRSITTWGMCSANNVPFRGQYDWCIDLLPRTPLPSNRYQNLSQPDKKAIEK